MTRSYNCELIVFAANEGGTLMAANSIYNMHRFGWDHYLLIVSSEAQCKKLRESPLQISCAWTTFLKEHKASALTRPHPALSSFTSCLSSPPADTRLCGEQGHTTDGSVGRCVCVEDAGHRAVGRADVRPLRGRVPSVDLTHPLPRQVRRCVPPYRPRPVQADSCCPPHEQHVRLAATLRRRRESDLCKASARAVRSRRFAQSTQRFGAQNLALPRDLSLFSPSAWSGLQDTTVRLERRVGSNHGACGGCADRPGHQRDVHGQRRGDDGGLLSRDEGAADGAPQSHPADGGAEHPRAQHRRHLLPKLCARRPRRVGAARDGMSVGAERLHGLKIPTSRRNHSKPGVGQTRLVVRGSPESQYGGKPPPDETLVVRCSI